MCPDSLWNSYNNAVRELNQEIKDMQADADDIKEGWGEKIIPQAQSIVQMEMKKRMDEAKAHQRQQQQQQESSSSSTSIDDSNANEQQQKKTIKIKY